MRCSRFLLSFLFLISPLAAQGDRVQRATRATPAPTLHLDLQRAVQLALQENLAIKVDAFGPEIARQRITAEAGQFDPELRASLLHETGRNMFGSETHLGRAEFGLSGFTPLGTTYNAGVNTLASEYGDYRSGLNFSINQPLLRGFGPTINLSGLRIARLDKESSDWALRQQVIAVVTQVHYVFNELYAAQQQLAAARHSRDLARQLEADEEVRASIGTRIALDVITARAEAAAREEAVIVAQARIEEYERLLKQLVTSDTATLLATRLSITPPPTPALGPIDLEAGIRDALELRPDYRQLLLELSIRDIRIVTARNATLPRLDLTASLELLGVTRGDLISSSNVFGGEARTPQSWSAGLVMRLPVPNRTARSQLETARLLKAQALVELSRLEQAIIVEIANAESHIRNSRLRIATTREAHALSQESLKAGNARLEAGNATTFEVLELQRREADAQAALIKAEADYRNAIVEYDRRTGTTLRRNRITIAPPQPVK